ncbi:hypothetical protein TNIN_98161 [Trichonephila inaurata madagascariensis]|uniref:Uncharacterized protein n=1 Tax=Trichonephila inaurata madagascariensis TaxID=2747483 RepID=A0A8X6MAV7_9ARAC|nr:hypothetical protein TNIN_98161 [Trichonephila inaurata madagascariensis]
MCNKGKESALISPTRPFEVSRASQLFGLVASGSVQDNAVTLVRLLRMSARLFLVAYLYLEVLCNAKWAEISNLGPSRAKFRKSIETCGFRGRKLFSVKNRLCQSVSLQVNHA